MSVMTERWREFTVTTLGYSPSRELFRICTRHRIKRELATAGSVALIEGAERTLSRIEKIATSPHIQAPLMFPSARMPIISDLWPEVMLWAYDSLNKEETTAYLEYPSLYEM